MKKIKLLTIIGMSSTAIPMIPIVATSCSFSDSLKEETVKQLIGLTKIPHPSNNIDKGERNNCAKIKEYLKGVVSSYGLEWFEQKNGAKYEGNAYFDIPATKGFEDKPTIILQGHMDMVYVNTEDKDGSKKLDYTINVADTYDKNGKRILKSADGKTNIGADDGVGISMMLALAKNKDKFEHGRLRCIFTTDEEIGLVGANHVPFTWFEYNGEQIDYLINLDSESYDTIYSACNGWDGRTTTISKIDSASKIDFSSGHTNVTTYDFSIGELKSGFIEELYTQLNGYNFLASSIDDIIETDSISEYYISSISAERDGVKYLPKSVNFTVSLDTNGVDKSADYKTKLEDYFSTLLETKTDENKNATIDVQKKDNPSAALEQAESTAFLESMNKDYNSYIDPEVRGEKEEIAGWLSTVYLNFDSNVNYQLVLRSSIFGFTNDVMNPWKTKLNAGYNAFNYVFSTSSPENKPQTTMNPWWSDNKDFFNLVKSGYDESLNIKEGHLIGFGVENTCFARYVKNMVSIGPSLEGIHSVDEVFYVDTAKVIFDSLLNTFKNI